MCNLNGVFGIQSRDSLKTKLEKFFIQNKF